MQCIAANSVGRGVNGMGESRGHQGVSCILLYCIDTIRRGVIYEDRRRCAFPLWLGTHDVSNDNEGWGIDSK